MARPGTSTDLNARIAVIGCGAWGANHLRVWRELGVLAAACDPDPARLEWVAGSYPGVTVHSVVEEVLADPAIDAVVIASSASTHAAITRAALRAGKDVLVEKPMALDADSARELVTVADEEQRILSVGHVLEYHPAVEHLEKLVTSGDLGKVRYLYSNRLNFGRIRTEENALQSFAPHDAAIILRLVGALPTQVSCHGGAYLSDGVADTTMTTLAFGSGVEAHIFVSWLHPFKEQRFVIVGDEQMAVFDDSQPWESKLVLYPHRIEWLKGSIPVANKAEAIAVPLEEHEPLTAECAHFLSCVTNRTQPRTDGTSGVRVMEVLDAAQSSLRSGGTPIPLEYVRGNAAFIHPTAVVDQGARIGHGTKVWHFSHVMSTARVGERCVIGQGCYLGPNARVGDGVKIQNNVSVYEGVELEDDVFCGPSVVFTNVVNPRSDVERKDEFRPTLVRRGASIGANATVVCGVTIGEHALVGGGATVTRDVAPYALVVGTPARRVGWVCACGVRLDDDGGACLACGRAYRVLGDALEPS